MKKALFITILALLCHFQLNAQSESYRDSIRYVNAYNYIVNDSIPLNYVINISEELTTSGYSSFQDEIISLMKDIKLAYLSTDDIKSILPESTLTDEQRREIALNIKLLQIDEDSEKGCFIYWRDFPQYPKITATLQFSKLIRDEVFARITFGTVGSILEQDENTTIGFDELWYYFIFDADDEIATVYSKYFHGI